MIEKKKSLEEIKKAAEKYFKLENEIHDYLKWKNIEDKISDEQQMQSHIDDLKEHASKLELKIKNRNDIFETIEQLFHIEYNYTTLLFMLLQLLKDIDKVMEYNYEHKKPCLCCEKKIPFTRPRICPECGHIFQGNGWDGIDAHWRAKHEENVMSYEDFWTSLCDKHKS